MDSFTIKSYGFQELAICYSPGVTGTTASRRLKQWIQLLPLLLDELRTLGWRPANRILTPMQVEVIIRYLGEP